VITKGQAKEKAQGLGCGTKLVLLLVATSMLGLTSCGSGSGSGIAANIVWNVDSSAFVLPNNLNSVTSANGGTTYFSCVASVPAPHIRMSTNIKWNGTGKLLPLIIKFEMKDNRLKTPDFSGIISADGSNQTVSLLFGVSATDYITNDNQTHYNTDYTSGNPAPCFMDFGGLPDTTSPIFDGGEVDITATFTMIGYQIGTDGVQNPFQKTTTSTIKYFPGSVIPATN